MTRNMHIAGSGKRAGQWVNCDASPTGEGRPCPLGGTHVSQDRLKTVQEWAGRRAFADLTKQDYIDYQQADRNGTLESSKRPLETLAEKRARLGKEVLVPKVNTKPGSKKTQTGTTPNHTQKVKPTSITEREQNTNQDVLLKKLHSFKAPRGLLGRLSRENRILEKKVHNRIVLTGSFPQMITERSPLEEYVNNLENNIEATRDNIKKVAKAKVYNKPEGFLKDLEERVDNHIAYSKAQENAKKQKLARLNEVSKKY